MQEVRSASSGSGNAEGGYRAIVSTGDGHRRRASSALPLDKNTDNGASNAKAYLAFDEGTTGLDKQWATRGPPPAAAPEATSTLEVTDAAAEAVASAASVGMASRARRRLRTCAPGKHLRVSSTVYSSASGCYSETGADTDAYVNADRDRIVFPGQITASSSGNEVFAWVAGELLSFSDEDSPVVNPTCVSDEDWAVNSHPADVESWSCLIGGSLVNFSGESFGAECGCSDGLPSSSAAAGSTSVPNSETAFLESASSSTVDSSSAGGSGCDADSFVVTFPHLDELGGCFQQDAGEEEEEGTSFSSQTSEHVGGVEVVYSAFFDEDEQDVRWVAGASAGSSSEGGIAPVCLSDNSASAAHPAESTWLCDFNATGAYISASEANFQVDCGCNSTTSSGTPTPSLGGSSTYVPSGAHSAGDGAPTPAPSFQPFAIDRLSTSGAAPCAFVPPSVLGMAGVFTMAGFVRQLAGVR